MSDLIQGLREAASGKGGLDYGDLWAYCDEAADELERLRAELAEALRERDALRAAFRVVYGHATNGNLHFADVVQLIEETCCTVLDQCERELALCEYEAPADASSQ